MTNPWLQRLLRHPSLTALAAGCAAALALPPWHFWPLLIPAFTTLALLVWRQSPVRAMYSGWSFGTTFFVTGLHWLAEAFSAQSYYPAWLGVPAVLLLGAALAVFPAAACAVAALGRGSGAGRVLQFAAAWTAAEWLCGQLFTGFPWNLIGYVWTASLPGLQLSAYAGIFGLTLLAVAVAAMPAAILATSPSLTRANMAISLFAALVVGLALGLGSLRIPNEHAITATRVRLVQPNIAQTDKWRSDLWPSHFARLVFLSRQPG